MADLVSFIADALYAASPTCCSTTLHDKVPCHKMRYTATIVAKALEDAPVAERMEYMGMKPVEITNVFVAMQASQDTVWAPAEVMLS